MLPNYATIAAKLGAATDEHAHHVGYCAELQHIWLEAMCLRCYAHTPFLLETWEGPDLNEEDSEFLMFLLGAYFDKHADHNKTCERKLERVCDEAVVSHNSG